MPSSAKGKLHFLDSRDLLRIARAVEWPIDTLNNQVNYIIAHQELAAAMWGNLQPFELWNRVPSALRNTVFTVFGQMLELTKTVCEIWTLTAYNLEDQLGTAHPGTKGLKPTPKYSLPFIHNPLDDVDLNAPQQATVDDSAVLGAVDSSLRLVYSILQGRYL
jgi:hypothetical protein